MNELELFKTVHGKSLIVGMSVTVDEKIEFSNEWPGQYVVLGINFKRSENKEKPGKIDVTIGEDWSDGGTDGWKPEDLVPSR